MKKSNKQLLDYEIKYINFKQQHGHFHPLTCCSHNTTTCDRHHKRNQGILIAKPEGMVCPCGAYKEKATLTCILSGLTTDENLLNVYYFGSTAYGTRSFQSDDDFILVVKEYFDPEDINIHVYTKEQFQLKLDMCDIQMLECFFLPEEFKLRETIKFEFNLNKFALRTSISTISSNSFVKGKKKLIVSGDYDAYLAIKSIFHSLRILDYGCQIAMHGKIINYKSMNYVLEDLKQLSSIYQHNDLWENIETRYKKIFNAKSSEFKALCPKDMTEKTKIGSIKAILSRHGIENEELLNELLTII